MRTLGVFSILVLVLGAVPAASAGDPFRERICDRDLGCVGPIMCVPNVACTPHPCHPGVDGVGCSATLAGSSQDCSINATYHGRTCQSTLHAGIGSDRPVRVPFVGDATGTSALVGVEVSNGSVDEHNLPNTWLAPGAFVDTRVAGQETGETSVGLYRSDITLDGAGTGPSTRLFPNANHTFSEFGARVRHDNGATGPVDATAAVLLLDLRPEGCFVRSASGTVADYRCPPFRELP